jgi:DNA repair photolyase
VYKTYKAKTILNIHKHVDGGWFWSKYSANPYIGCEWGCQYCYARDEKYNPHKPERDPLVIRFKDPFSEYIKIKENAPELLKNSLKKKPRDIIYLDNYMPIDVKYQLTRQMLEVCLELNFPVFINEKSSLILRDLDILKKISNKSYLNIGWSIITTKDDETRRIIESNAPSVESRFKTMKRLSDNKIFTGTIFMPIIPFIYDDEENIELVIKKTKNSGGQYILDGGLTLWGYCKTYFYKTLEKNYPDLIERYEKLYNDSKIFNDYNKRIHKLVLKYCNKYKIKNYIPRPISFYPKNLQINKRIAEVFYLKARELQITGETGYKERGYRKIAWILDDLNKNIRSIYNKYGIKGLKKIKGIGDINSKRIEDLLKNNDFTLQDHQYFP